MRASLRKNGFLTAPFVIVFALATPVFGQTLQDAIPPAELPPSSFSGGQFVDSRGCVFIRAGFDGTVQWAPRVTRDGRQICGLQPTFGAGNTPVPNVAAVPAAPSQRALTHAQACDGRTGVQPDIINQQTGQPIDCGGPRPVQRPAATPTWQGVTRAEACAESAATGRQFRNSRTGLPLACDG